VEVLTGEQMRRVDRRAIDGMGIPSLALMEAAGRGVAEALLADHPRLTADPAPVTILCGKGNNGGDGLVAARYLASAGVTVRVVLLASASELRGDAAENLSAARAHGIEVVEAADEPSWSREAERLDRSALVLDAVLGTGVRGGARGLPARAIRDLERSSRPVVSIDLPSGMDADRREVEGVTVRATRTYTLCRPKLPLIDGEGAARAGMLRVIPIGIPDEAVRAEGATLGWLDPHDLRGLLPRRETASHKGSFGHLLALAGSRGKPGAAVLVARGALRSGVGLVTVATAASAAPVVSAQQAEIMTESIPETPAGAPSVAALDRVLKLAGQRDALALGPGLGTEDGTRELIAGIVRSVSGPLVVDADGLNAFPRGEGLEAGGRSLVLTPHPGEAARLGATDTASVQADRLGAARTLAVRTGAVVVLKGHRTVIAAPDGRVAVNSTGNPGMATAGSGDVLTGIVGSLLARGMHAWDAARLAAFAHGDAGDRAARDVGQEGMIAGDLLDRLPRALEALVETGEPT